MIRCTNCIHFKGKGKHCPKSPRQPDYQNDMPRNCGGFYAKQDARQLPALPKWINDPLFTAQTWNVASRTAAGATAFFTMVFPKPVTGYAALDEAARHWQDFKLDAAPLKRGSSYA